MPSLDGLLIVVAAGFAAPFLLGLAPAVRTPAVVLQAGPEPVPAGRFGTT
jgi:hypothetical protein